MPNNSPAPHAAALIAALSHYPLALKRDALAQLLMSRRAYDDTGPDDGVPSQADDRLLDGGIVVIPIRGLIAPRLEDVGYCDCAVTLMEPFMAEIDRLKTDDSVRGVVLDISSPGGIVWLVPEAARKVRELAAIKPVHAVANAQAASAAFYLMAAAGKRFVTRSGDVGSVGVWCMHVDQSKMLKEWGVDVTLIYEGEHKVDGNSFEPLPEPVKKAMQADVRQTYEMFRDDMAAYVGVSVETVENEWQARCLSATDALAAGMVDGIASLDEVIANLQAELLPVGELAPEPRADASELECRSLDGVISAAGSLVGTALRFSSPSNDLGGFREEFEAGAFDASIAADDIRVVWQHDPKYVFGRVRAGTATVKANAESLNYTANPPDAQWARDAVESIRRGDVTQNSFAFMVTEPRKDNERWERRATGLHRIIKAARLVEMGPQTNPAYSDTTVAVRSMNAALLVDPTLAAVPIPSSVPGIASLHDRLRAVQATL